MRAFRIVQHPVVKDETQGKSLNRIWKKSCRLNPKFWNKICVANFIADGNTEPFVKIINKVTQEWLWLAIVNELTKNKPRV